MDGYRAEMYGERVADTYDEEHAAMDPTAAVDRLADLAQGGPALELAIGTGRVALPLAARGIRVDGIDVSPAMVAKLRAKPGGEAIAVTMGDFADVGVRGRYPLIYVVFNTFFALLSQDEQVRCFANVADHLTDDGVFAMEAFVPELGLYSQGSRVSTRVGGLDRVQIDTANLDRATQQISAMHLVVAEAGVRMYPVRLRYAWPAELDLMARLAGLRLLERWAAWGGEPFTADSGRHVSVYGR